MTNDNSSSRPAIFAASDSGSLPQYISTKADEIEAALQISGAVLFRGFSVPDAEAFDAAVMQYGGTNFAYEKSLSNAVRVNVTDRVFTANEAPATTEIFLHHEMAQTPIYPSKLMFYCEIAANEGGQTPLCRSDILLAAMEQEIPGLVSEFETKGVQYTNTMPAQDDAGSGQGRSWRSTLGVGSKDEAENRLLQLGYSWEWQPDDTLTVTTPRLDAVRVLPDGRRSFFNQLIAAYRGWSDSRNEASKSIRFGDGSAIDHGQMMQAIALADQITYDHAWQAGDVVLVDNYTVMHGRRPFKGKRRVLASLLA